MSKDTFGTLTSEKSGAHDGGERDEGSVGASSGGIRPYAKERKGSARPRAAPDQTDSRLSAVQQLLSSANARAADDDSFALEVQRVPGSSSKNYTASKSMGRR